MSKVYYKLMLLWLEYYRDKQIYEPKIDVIDAKIWYYKCKLGQSK